VIEAERAVEVRHSDGNVIEVDDIDIHTPGWLSTDKKESPTPSSVS